VEAQNQGLGVVGNGYGQARTVRCGFVLVRKGTETLGENGGEESGTK
jgi:hypothetical protein